MRQERSSQGHKGGRTERAAAATEERDSRKQRRERRSGAAKTRGSSAAVGRRRKDRPNEAPAARRLCTVAQMILKVQLGMPTIVISIMQKKFQNKVNTFKDREVSIKPSEVVVTQKWLN